MAVSARWFPRAYESAFEGEWDWVGGEPYAMLVTSSYTPADSHKYISDGAGTNEHAATGGYTADGKAITTPTNTFTDDASANAWAASTAYQVGDIVRPLAGADGHVYRCIVAGTSGSGAPTWDQTPGQDTTDNTVTWTEWGRGFVTLNGANLSWPSSTITARYAVIYDRVTVGTADTARPLIGLVDFGQDESSSGSPFELNWATAGILQTSAGYGGT